MATRKRTDQISGKHSAPRFILSDKELEFQHWRELAKKRGISFSDWLREAGREKAEREK